MGGRGKVGRAEDYNRGKIIFTTSFAFNKETLICTRPEVSTAMMGMQKKWHCNRDYLLHFYLKLG